MRKHRRTFCLIVGISATLFPAYVLGQSAAPSTRTVHLQVSDHVLDSVVQIQLTAEGETRAVGSGVIVRGDGLILTAYHLVKGASSIGVRLRNGETFDRADVVAADERRNVALISVPANLGLAVQPITEEGFVGASVAQILGAGEVSGSSGGLLTSVALADEIPGAGSGFRILKFTTLMTDSNIGGLLTDDRGRPLGLLAANPQAQNQNYAVPLSSLMGLVRSAGFRYAPNATAPSQAQNRPFPIPQDTVSVPQRGVLELQPKGPGSVVVKPSKPVDVLLVSKTIYVESYSETFKPEHLVNALSGKSEMNEWGLSFVDEREVADLVLTLDHVLFTWKYTFKLAHQRTGVVVASGDVIIWDGNLGAGHMAKRVIEKLTKVRAQTPTPANQPEKKAEEKTK